MNMFMRLSVSTNLEIFSFFSFFFEIKGQNENDAKILLHIKHLKLLADGFLGLIETNKNLK